jgi:hypothetical protein
MVVKISPKRELVNDTRIRNCKGSGRMKGWGGTVVEGHRGVAISRSA